MSQEQQELFEGSFDSSDKTGEVRDLRRIFEVPLPERMRPTNLEEFVGQSHLLGEGKPLRRLLKLVKSRTVYCMGPRVQERLPL